MRRGTQQPRVRQFCVDIAHSFIWRNIDAELLREHCVRRICAHYNFCNFCAISPFASTFASKLSKKIKKSHAQRSKKNAFAKKNLEPGFEPGISNFKAATLTTQPTSFPYTPSLSSCPKYVQGAIFAQFLRKCCSCIDACAEIAHIFCAIAPIAPKLAQLFKIAHYKNTILRLI